MPIAADHALPLPAGVGAPARRLDPNQLGDHLDRLYRAAWALCGSREDAEDLVQDTYARVLQKPRMLRSDDDLGYLLRVLRNTYFSRLRAAARRPRTDPLPDDLDRVEDRYAKGPETALDSAELYAQIAELPDPFREALVAIDVVGLSYREAARVAARSRGDDHHPAVPGPPAPCRRTRGLNSMSDATCPPPLERARARSRAPRRRHAGGPGRRERLGRLVDGSPELQRRLDEQRRARTAVRSAASCERAPLALRMRHHALTTRRGRRSLVPGRLGLGLGLAGALAALATIIGLAATGPAGTVAHAATVAARPAAASVAEPPDDRSGFPAYGRLAFRSLTGRTASAGSRPASARRSVDGRALTTVFYRRRPSGSPTRSCPGVAVAGHEPGAHDDPRSHRARHLLDDR